VAPPEKGPTKLPRLNDIMNNEAAISLIPAFNAGSLITGVRNSTN